MRTPTRRRAGALLVLVPLLCNSLISGAPSAGADAIADKKAEAERIARQLEVQSRQVSILAEDYDEARVRIDAVAAELADAGARVATTDSQAARIRSRLKEQSVEAYIRGGSAQALGLLADTRSTEELAVRSQYVRTITAGAGDVLDELRTVRLHLDDQRARLADVQAEAKAAAELAERKRREAAAAEAAQQRTLRQAQGELASMVEAESARRAAEEAKRAEAELAARSARAEAAARAAAAPAPVARPNETAAPPTLGRSTTTAAPAASPPAPGPTAQPSTTTTARPTTTTTARVTTTTTATPPAPTGGNPPPPASGAEAAIAEARRQIGKPYEWGGSGPDTFDCSGLTSWAWRAGGKSLPHSSRAQFAGTSRVALADIRPGDLLFYGDPIHHVALYIGDGQMIEAPETGKNVRYASIYRRDFVGAGRVN